MQLCLLSKMRMNGIAWGYWEFVNSEIEYITWPCFVAIGTWTRPLVYLARFLWEWGGAACPYINHTSTFSNRDQGHFCRLLHTQGRGEIQIELGRNVCMYGASVRNCRFYLSIENSSVFLWLYHQAGSWQGHVMTLGITVLFLLDYCCRESKSNIH